MTETDQPFSDYATGRIPIEKLLDQCRRKHGHPSSWHQAHRPAPPTGDDEPRMCAAGLHRRTPENITPQRHCRPCQSISRKRRRHTAQGRTLCWTGTHELADRHDLCSCGHEPPAPDSVDWVAVERAADCDPVGRPLTNGEQVSVLRTTSARLGVGPYDAALWLAEHTGVQLTEDRVHYLLDRWQPAGGHPPIGEPPADSPPNGRKTA